MHKAAGTIVSGILVASLGIVVLIGWILRSPLLVQIVPGFTAMVINTAVCFVLGGLAVVLPIFFPAVQLKLQTAFGGIIACLAVLQLAENFSLISGVDWVTLHNWLADGNPNPGRMAPNTALGFLLAGAALVGMPRIHIMRDIIALRLLTASIIFIGVSGVVGYFLHLEFLYSWYGISRMALHTATGMATLGISLWLSWAGANWNQPQGEVAERRRILGTSAFVLFLVAITAGLSGFTILQKRMEENIGQNLSRMHQDRTLFFGNTIEHRLQRAAIVATRPSFTHNLRDLEKTGNSDALNLIKESMESFLRHGFSGITLLSHDGRDIVSVGKLITEPDLSIRLGTPHYAELLWKNGYLLRVKLPVIDQGRTIANVIAEQPMPVLTQMASTIMGWGETGEMGVCGQITTGLICFPQRLKPEIFKLPHVINGEQLPMSRAFDGKTGITLTRDYRRQQVIAAFGLIGNLGIGMVLKMDVAEIYRPIREQFQLALLLLLLVVLAGTWLLRTQVGPLVSNVHNTRRIAQENEARFRAAAEGGLDAFYILESERDKQDEIVDFRFTYLNRIGESSISLTRDKALDHYLCELLPAYRTNGLFDKYKQVVNTGESLVEDLQMNEPNTPAAWIHHQIVKLGDGIAITSRNITNKKLSEERLLHMAQSDALTGLPNRALFYDRLEQAVTRAKRNRQTMAVMYLDIDHFKSINDSLGHGAGDELLIRFAQRLKQSTRASDTVARLGGDEFTIIVEGLHSEADSEKIATTIMEAMRPLINIDGHMISISTSIGVACLASDQIITTNELLQRADLALYKVKSHGRNGFEIYAEPEPQPDSS
ncbi:MAG: diguanylate cyclase [Pseudomonadota bacterium]